jgi:putative transposase
MPRRLRIHVPGGFYHATLRGNHRRDIFFAEHDYQLLSRIVARCLDRFVARLHAYCWMSNHLHLLIQVSDQPLSCFMRQVASEFARAMQEKISTTGHWFERRYHSTVVDADSYLLELVRYIHLNPAKANIVKDLGDYRWSSHHAYLGTRAEAWVSTDFVLQMFSSDRARAVAAYREFLRVDPDSFAPELARASDRMGILGSDEFRARVQATAVHVRPQQSLDDLIGEACRRFGVERVHLAARVRDPTLAKVRAWIAHHAVVRRIAGMSAVARLLERDESTLREAIRRYSGELK